MKKVLILLLFTISIVVSATDYYVSSTGNDSNNGLSGSSPWKTISKVNSAFSGLLPGDRILFNRGDTFYGTLIIAKSGTATNPIFIGAYGSGANPIINGFTTLSSWTNQSGGIYSENLVCESHTNVVTLNSVNTPMGRYPNTGYLTYESYSGTSSITDNQLAATPNWTGAEVVIRKNAWILDRNLITNHSGHTLTYTALGAVTTASNGFGYFIQNDLKTLDVLGEWYYNGTSFYMYFGTANPNDYVVKTSSLNELILISGYSYITLDNLDLEGANIHAINVDNSTHITIQNCLINFSGTLAIIVQSYSSYVTLNNNVINYSNDTGVKVDATASNVTVTNNQILNTATIVGSFSTWGARALDLSAPNSIAQYNRIINTGYNGIQLNGTNTSVKNNLIDNFCTMMDDGGGIYTAGLETGRVISGNIILNGKGNPAGTTDPTYFPAEGIYLDEPCTNILVDNNTVAFCGHDGIKLHEAQYITITNNTCFNNKYQLEYTGSGSQPSYPINYNTVNSNIFVARTSNKYVLSYLTSSGNADAGIHPGTSNNNCFARPIDDNKTFNIYVDGTDTWPGDPYTLAQWRTMSGQDANSKKSPISVTDTNSVRFEYNPTNSDEVLNLGANYLDVNNVKYPGTITLAPYKSAVLILDPDQSDDPIYLSSVIENETPSVLEMTYSLNLANIVPAASSFNVIVNSASRSVNSVAIVGDEVQLTLASPVTYGDIVTVAYTKPSSNPLQNPTGSPAASFTAQNVTNNVNPVNPSYVSSVIENATPTLLTVTYDLTLANIVPAVSAFTVKVNKVTRTISTISISGTQVQLILASPIVYGDAVTVAYSVPASNPLQSTSGGLVVSLTAQTVTNNVKPAIPAYVSSVIEDATPSLLTMVYNLTLANIVPDASAFTVMVNTVVRSITSVSVSGTNVILTLSSPVVYGDVITVAYTKPASNPLQTSSGGLAVTITSQIVTNNVNSDYPTYITSVIQNDTPTLLSITYNITLANIVPSSSAFTVMVNNVARTITAVTISGTIVQLTLASPIVYGDIVTVSYTQPGINPLQSLSGDEAVSITAQKVTNNTNPPNPTYVSSVVQNSTPSLLTLTYSSALANVVPATYAFRVMVNNNTRTVTAVAISGTNVQLTLASPIVFGDVITVSYTKPSRRPLQTASGGQAASITAQTVTNNVLAASPIYVSSSIENATPTLLVMIYNIPLAIIVPAPSAFSVSVNNTTRTIITVAISGTKVSLTLASPVVYGDIITISYTKPSANPLQTSSGMQAVSISAQPVTNNVNPNNPSYVSSVIENATPTLLTMTYSLSLTNIVPSSSAFTVTVNSIVVPVISVSLTGTLVQLTLTIPVVYGDVVTVAYTKPTTNPLQTSAGAQAASITAQPVTNNVTTVNPTYVSSVIENATPTILTMTYNLNLVNIVPAVSAFTVRVNNVTVQINSVAISGTKVILTLANSVVNGNVVTVAYTKPATNPLQTSAGGQAASITAQPVTNNVNPVNPVNPVYVSSSIENANPALLTMTYSLTLANIVPSGSAFSVNVNNVARTVTAVSISATTVLLTLATPVVNGDVITVAYTKPATNPLQTSSGGQAASMTAQAVTNNVNPVSQDNPTYVSSVIENATPALLEMTYSLSLANIIPSTSSFRVRVNNVTRSITAVAVSGTEVQLTLSAPVISGDVVTVSYTKPSRNPLQTPSGGQAASIRSQRVTNNVNPIVPVAPSYVSSVIENATPSLLEMTYDLNLSNVVPDTSAFSVLINSVATSVLSVAITGNKVQLMLKNQVVYGDIVFVSYTQPAINPIQSSAGIRAESINFQPVTNNVSFINSPPVIVINYESNNYSGFVGKIDASGTYDINGDSLTFSWTIPANVEVSSTDSSIIQFLAPIVQVNDTVEFILNVSDGYSVQSQTIAINIFPYKPELAASKITKVSASDFYAIYFPNNIIDGNPATIWSADGTGQWVSLELDKPFKIGYFELAFQEGQNRASYFDIYASTDGSEWDQIFTDASSCNFASGYQIFDMPVAKTNSVYSFIKLVGRGNSEDSWNAYSEIKIFGKPYFEYAQMNIYPNPANEIVNISILYPTSFSTEGAVVFPSNIRFFDSSGRLVLDKQVAPGTSVVQIPINFSSGIYIVQMVSDGLILSANKLIVVN